MKHQPILPYFHLSLGITLLYLSLLLLLPLAALSLKALIGDYQHAWAILTSKRTLAAYWLSLYTSFIAAVINTIFGLLVAWVLVRYRFFGRALCDALIDLPFALPTAVAGIALTALYTPSGWIGQWFDAIGIQIAYTPLGVMIALIFIGLPFVVRTVQPVLEDLEVEIEEAAASLGATPAQIFWRVILPYLTPALLTGFALAFARALGEYGSVIFIAGNLPMTSEIAPLLIMNKLEQYDYHGAAVIAFGMLLMSFIMLFIINGLQGWGKRE